MSQIGAAGEHPGNIDWSTVTTKELVHVPRNPNHPFALRLNDVMSGEPFVVVTWGPDGRTETMRVISPPIARSSSWAYAIMPFVLCEWLHESGENCTLMRSLADMGIIPYELKDFNARYFAVSCADADLMSLPPSECTRNRWTDPANHRVDRGFYDDEIEQLAVYDDESLLTPEGW
ncbi:MAG: hypothetical protein JWO07_122 [Candidatus Saccharibacteria bacterium]|nr:hypothetical protein [Candidatus Saccharibacteria bacterium]